MINMKQAEGADRIQARNGKRKRVDRINLQQLKAKLSKILGPRKERDYCNLFSSFLSQRLSKAELDRQLPQTIGRDNIRLHNQIVRAILYNAICDTTHLVDQIKPPPPGPKVDEHVEELAQEAGDGDEFEITAPLGLPWRKRRRKTRGSWRVEVEQGEDDDRHLLLPDTGAMHRRMEKLVVNDEGLQGLNEDCALVLNQALDAHLKSLITSCIRLKRSSSNSSPSSSSGISAVDFHLAMSLDPKQLGSNWPVHLERLSLLAFEQQEQRTRRSQLNG